MQGSTKKMRVMLFGIIIMLFVSSITVSAATFTLSKTKATVNVGEQVDLDILGSTEDATWTSWNVNRVTVDQDGVVTALRTGKTTVSARIGNTRKKCEVTVVSPSVKLNKSSATIYTGGTSAKTVKLTTTVKGSSKAVTWSSSAPEVATVDNTGTVTSVAPGKAVISATANGKTANCNVTVKESSITLSETDMKLSTKGNGSAINLKPTVVGSKKTVTWSSSDKKVATVDKNGKVTGKKSGTAVITAKANGVSAICNVTVEKGSISFSKESTLLYVGETESLKTNAAKNASVTYRSSNPAVATVNEKGKVTAVAEGITVITVVSGDTTDTCDVTVKNTVTSVKENGIALETKGTTTYKLKATVTGRKSTVTWKSADKTIATVDKTGKVTAKKAGTTTITATANGVSDTVQVIVENYDPTIKLNYKDYVLYTKKGNTLTLKPTIVGKSQKVAWKSSNPAVAKVSTKGKVTALAEGQAVITATANGVSAECLIDVKKSEVVLETKNMWLEKGQKGYLPADFIGAGQTYTYKSSNTKIATVNNNGLVTAKKNGTAKITVSANGVSATCLVYVNECTHEFDEGIVTTAPTCKDKGVRTITCGKCGYAYAAEEAKVDHNWEVAEHVDATCIASGADVYKCTVCETERRDVLSKTDHSWGEWEVIVESSEESEGFKRQSCKTEGCIAKNEESLPRKEHIHNYTAVVTNPGCTEEGYTTFTCRCGDSYVSDKVEAIGHDWGIWEETKAATVANVGEEKRSCKREGCGETEKREIPKLNYDTYLGEEGTLGNEFYLSIDTSLLYTADDEVIKNVLRVRKARGDKYNKIFLEYGDLVPENRISAEVCNAATDILENRASGGLHNLVVAFESGEKEVRWALYGLDKIATDIEFGTVSLDVSEEENGGATLSFTNTSFPCESVLLNIYEHSENQVVKHINAFGENHIELYVYNEQGNLVNGNGRWIEYVPYSDRESCIRVYGVECWNSGEIYSLRVSDAHVHSYSETVTEPTCTEEGYTTYTCSCGDSYVDDRVAVLGHDWSEWEETKAATEEAEGEETRTCKRESCDEVETRSIPKKEHSHTYEAVVTEPTCIAEGYTTYTCGCGDSYVDDQVVALGHEWSDWEEAKAATETEKGEEKRSCKREGCGVTETREIPQLNDDAYLGEEYVEEGIVNLLIYMSEIDTVNDEAIIDILETREKQGKKYDQVFLEFGDLLPEKRISKEVWNAAKSILVNEGMYSDLIVAYNSEEEDIRWSFNFLEEITSDVEFDVSLVMSEEENGGATISFDNTIFPCREVLLNVYTYSDEKIAKYKKACGTNNAEFLVYDAQDELVESIWARYIPYSDYEYCIRLYDIKVLNSGEQYTLKVTAE